MGSHLNLRSFAEYNGHLILAPKGEDKVAYDYSDLESNDPCSSDSAQVGSHRHIPNITEEEQKQISMPI
jgi:hypothetical protein